MQKNNDEMSFLDHLEVLRWHLIRGTIVVLLIGIVAFVFKSYIFEYVIFAHKNGDFPTYRFFCNLATYFGVDSDFCRTSLPIIIQNRTMTGQFSIAIWTSIWTGVIIGFPYLLYELWQFISPALYQSERRIAKQFIATASVLFFIGVAFGFFIIAPLTINFFANYSVSHIIENKIDTNSYIAIVRSSLLASGFIFELPIIIYFLAKINLITPEFLRKYRRHAIVITLIIAAVITPPDVISQIIISIPLLILYEISIYICTWVIKKQTIKAE